MRVAYVDSHQAASRRALFSSGASATGTHAETRVGVGSSTRDSPSCRSARPSCTLDRAPEGPHRRPAPPASRIDPQTAPPTRSAPARPENAQAQRPGTRRGIREPIARQERANRRQRLAQSHDWPGPRDAVKALGERRAAGADTKRKSTSGAALDPSRAESDGRRRASPHRNDRSAEVDARGPQGKFRQQDHRIVSPPLSDVHPIKT